MGNLNAIMPMKESRILELEKEQEKLLNTCRALRAENKDLGERAIDAEAESQLLRTKVMTLQQELETCRDDLFRVQPSVQIPDTEILNEYECISQQILSWIDGEIRNFEKEYPDVPSEKLYSAGEDSDMIGLLKRYPDTGEYLVRRRIHRCLQEHIWNKNIYLVGLPSEIVQALEAAEQSMATYDPPRDPATINTWRSETLNALAASNVFRKSRDEGLQRLTTYLLGALSKTFPIVNRQRESMMKLYRQVILPAAELAVKIQVSVSIYEFQPSLARHPLMQFRVDMQHLLFNQFIDITTNKTLKPNSGVIADKDGWIGEAWMYLEPGLVRLDPGKKDTELRKPIYLVGLYEPVDKRGLEIL